MIDSPSPRGNPFATRYTRPGSLPFLFPPGEDVERLISCLQANGWWGQIVGPHGSGKSTLLAMLTPALEAANREVLAITLHDGQRRLPGEVWRQRFVPATQLVIDGYEQLSRWQRLRIKRRCKLSGGGLLATAHGSVGLPDLYRIAPDANTAVRVVQALLPAREAVVREEIEACFARHHGDMREMLFALYDHYERRRTST